MMDAAQYITVRGGEGLSSMSGRNLAAELAQVQRHHAEDERRYADYVRQVQGEKAHIAKELVVVQRHYTEHVDRLTREKAQEMRRYFEASDEVDFLRTLFAAEVRAIGYTRLTQLRAAFDATKKQQMATGGHQTPNSLPHDPTAHMFDEHFCARLQKYARSVQCPDRAYERR